MLLCMEQRIVKEDHKIAFPHSLNLKMTICLIVNPGKRKREKEHKNETLVPTLVPDTMKEKCLVYEQNMNIN